MKHRLATVPTFYFIFQTWMMKLSADGTTLVNVTIPTLNTGETITKAFASETGLLLNTSQGLRWF